MESCMALLCDITGLVTSLANFKLVPANLSWNLNMRRRLLWLDDVEYAFDYFYTILSTSRSR